MSILKEFDVVVEGRTDGLYKPDPAAWYIHSACRSPGLIRRG